MINVLQSCVPVAEEGLTWGEPMGHVVGTALLFRCAYESRLDWFDQLRRSSSGMR